MTKKKKEKIIKLKNNSGNMIVCEGVLSSKEGPAVHLKDGTKMWFLNGHRHRQDGPAIEYAHGDVEYYYEGRYFSSKEEYEKFILLETFK